MGNVTKSIEIEASPEKVFAYISNMENMNKAAIPSATALSINVTWKLKPKYLKPTKTRKLPIIVARLRTALSCPRRAPALPSRASSIPMVAETGMIRCCPRL